jgi:translation elongation factor EF-4
MRINSPLPVRPRNTYCSPPNCYSGDITGKRMLLEQHQEGKKRVRRFGKVEIPQSAVPAAQKMDA